MDKYQTARLRAQTILLGIACIGAPMLCFGSDTYDPTLHQLAIKELQYGNATFWDMVVTPDKVLGIAGGTPNGFWDAYIYNYLSGYELLAPAVVVGPTTYTNVTATIAKMDSLGSVSGADSYDGHYLYIPSAKVGTTTYNYAVITVAGIDGLAGGFPSAQFDTYNAANHQLGIPAVAVGSKAYTNVNVTVGQVISVNGSASVPGGGNASTCYNPSYYATGTTMNLFYQDLSGNAALGYENQTVVVAPSTFGGVANAVGIQTTTTTSQGPATATIYYDISRAPTIFEIGIGSPTVIETFSPSDQFGGALTYGQSVQSSGTLGYNTFTEPYSTDFIFLGLEDVTVPAGTFQNACKWSDSSTFNGVSGKTTTWISHQGVVLQVGTVQLQAGSTFNGAPVGP